MIRHLFTAALLLLALSTGAARGADLPVVPEACAPHMPFGGPALTTKATMVCRRGFALAHDPVAMIPRWTVHRPSAASAYSCADRTNRFRADPDLPAGQKAALADYALSGWDRGHLVPDADMRHDPEAGDHADYLSNIAPQNPTLNRGLWKKLEETVRAWSTQRALWVVTGTILGDEPHTIGRNRVRVPAFFFKVVVDVREFRSISFLVPNTAYGWDTDLARFTVSPDVIEAAAGIRFPTPWWGPMRPADMEPWPADLGLFMANRERRCAASPPGGS
jgi:endonuclease G, mitochondrial